MSDAFNYFDTRRDREPSPERSRSFHLDSECGTGGGGGGEGLDGIKKRLKDAGLELEEPYPGIIAVHGFAQSILGIDPNTLLTDLDERVPIKRGGDSIEPGQLQWVAGDHPDLMYRGNALRRRKIWIQDGPVDERIHIYSYTGWQNAIAFATSDWNADAPLRAICGAYNAFIGNTGFKPANHAIITAYDNEHDSVGFHSDKMRSLAQSGLISVVKLGNPRTFAVRADGSSPAFFEKELPAGTLVLMTAEANEKTQHAVPEMNESVGLSGSIVFRTVVGERPVQVLAQAAQTAHANRAARQAARQAAAP